MWLTYVYATFLAHIALQHVNGDIVANVPSETSSLFDAVGSSCSSDSDCNDRYAALNEWLCLNTSFVDDNSNHSGICVFTQCAADDDCSNADEKCWTIYACYDGSVLSADTESTYCAPSSLCDDITTDGERTNDTMCYQGTAEDIYFSAEEANICNAKCTVSEVECKSEESASSCKDDNTCCTKNFEFNDCGEFLTSGTYLYYTIGVGVAVLLCLCLCCCVCYKKCKRKQYDDKLEERTDPYSTYI